jgi:hypothetical protein
VILFSSGVEDDGQQIRGDTITPLDDFSETGSLKSHE